MGLRLLDLDPAGDAARRDGVVERTTLSCRRVSTPSGAIEPVRFRAGKTICVAGERNSNYLDVNVNIHSIFPLFVARGDPNAKHVSVGFQQSDSPIRAM